MKKISSTCLAAFLYFAAISGPIETKLSVHFDTDKYHLSPTDHQKLIHFLDSLNWNVDGQFTISGHTDNIGDYSYNDSLSYRRMRTIKNLLREQGVEGSKILASFHGEYKPVETNAVAKGRSQNRRVDLTFTQWYFKDTKDLCETINEDYKTSFTIDPSDSQTLEGKHGTVVGINANSFEYGDGREVSENVTLNLIEAQGYESFLANNLSTLSKNGLLESGGMFKINAYNNNGEELFLKEGSTIQVVLPSDSTREGMDLFTSIDGQNWVNTQRAITAKSSDLCPDRPKRPRLARLPKHVVDSSDRPRKPVRPAVPRYPHEPRPESYKPDINWYNFIFANSIKERNNRWYASDLEEFYAKVAKYDVKYAKYKDRMKKYKEDYKYYLELLAEWKQEKKEEEKQFYANAMELRRKGYQRSLDKYVHQLMEWRKACELTNNNGDNDTQPEDLSAEFMRNELNQYTFSIGGMGWMNVDKLVATEDQLFTSTVWDNDDSDERVMMILPRFYSMLGMRKVKGEPAYEGGGIPKYEQAYVLAYKVIDGSPYIFQQEVNPDNPNIEMTFKKVTYQQFREVLASMERRAKSSAETSIASR